jgi:ABC-type taurine transport system substrate-binding protein
VSKAFVDRDLDVVLKFLTHIEVSNRRYLESPEKLLGAVSSAAGMDPDEARLLLEGFQFPSLAEQASEHWLGGSIQVLMKQFMDFLVAWDIVPVALESYEPFANPSLLNAVD